MQQLEGWARRAPGIAVLAVALACGATSAADPAAKPPAAAAKDEIKLEQTDYAGFFKAVEKFKGKVVLVDVWAEF